MSTVLHYPSIKISSGSIEGLKWLAMIFMTIDHFNRIFLEGHSALAYGIGRMAMPLFAIVFAYNLARPAEFVPQIYFKTFKRLVFFGVLATPAYVAMLKIQGLLPLNILFTFLVAATTLYFYQKDGPSAHPVACFLMGGILVEYYWFGVMICLTFWLYCKKPSLRSLLACVVAYYCLDLANGNHWTLLAIPILFFVMKVDMKIPRWRYFFWIYYPLHLTGLVLIKRYIPVIFQN